MQGCGIYIKKKIKFFSGKDIMTKLLIVESPTKARTIERMLGKDYTIVASMGHIRDLPEHELGVDIDNNFAPKYVDNARSRSVVKQLQSSAAKADEIYLLENENPYKEKGGRPKHSGREMKTTVLSSEVDLRGMDSIEAVCVMERYLDEAMRSNLKSVRIIHGKGTGVLRAAVHQSLRKNKYVKKYRLGVYGEGEDGVTIAEFS